ncbi:MAG TPA: MarR family transcriptional regulator [Nitrospirales bacterium]|jgi:DNA-binding MarR family transcriptional regulator|nr:MarR family transcriptional regulator [Nitrospirales bacterium]HIA13899.1 MarR family transcriptional regulator [Nitrospirales bacterium]HIC04290.1 MarR family transcriptional regulator [Nitrospirales bacterium]HIN33989.1 MarR family transcriptional regulator [Nitrospirales bacterium]HIO69117.1 MarR family transcriptional regulator [Nitrospirales bacterium]
MMLTDFKRDPYLRLLRPLVEAYLAFYRVSSRQIEFMGVTASQFDVIVELGDVDGMTCAELSKETLITKGTLTGVLDRLESKGIVQRQGVGGDRRAILVCLTNEGQQLYKHVFPTHADFLRPYFKNALSQEEVRIMTKYLLRLRDSFEPVASGKEKTSWNNIRD